MLVFAVCFLRKMEQEPLNDGQYLLWIDGACCPYGRLFSFENYFEAIEMKMNWSGTEFECAFNNKSTKL